MAKKEKFRGHEIEILNGEYVFSDTKDPTISTWQDRPCGYCGKYNTDEGHDGCLGAISNVINACCGHGSTNEAYIQYSNGHIIRGSEVCKALNEGMIICE